MKYFHIMSTSDTLLDLDSNWLNSVRAKILCSECGKPFPNAKQIDVVIEDEIVDTPLNVCSSLALGIIRLDFLSAVGLELFSEHFVVGQVFTPSRDSIDDFFTFRGKSEVLIHGGENSTDRTCSQCQRRILFPIGRRYAFAAETSNTPMMETQFSQILAREDTISSVIHSEWREIAFKETPLK